MLDLPVPLLSFISTASVAVVAGTLSYVAGKGMKKHEWALNMRREKVVTRQRLYADFLAEADRQVLQSMKEKVGDVAAFYELTRKFSEIELLSSDEVCAAAKLICDHVISSHAIDGKVGTAFYDLKRTFIHSARTEMANYEK